MISIKELDAKWNNISPLTGGFLLVSGEHPLSFHVGYANGENKCFIVLNTGKIDKIPSSKAICAENIQTVDGGFALRFILNYPSLDELFIKLCWDLIDSSLYDEKPVEKIVSQYKRWMKLLQQASPGILSPSMQKGLIGELLYLEEKITEIGEEKALKAWVGPEGSDQDFVFEHSWAEVKSTSIASDTVTISSVQQLDCQEKGLLIVYFMDKTSSKGLHTRTLPEIVKKVKSLLSCQYHDELLCKLAKNGYFEKDVEQYATYMYRLTEKRIFLVDTNFPRLTRENIPVEVINARYDISLSAIDSHRI